MGDDDQGNPLLADTPFPLFDRIRAEHVVPGMSALHARLHLQLDALEGSVQPTWGGLMEPLERLTDELSRVGGIVRHLKKVRDSDALRAAAAEVEPADVQLSMRLSQSVPLYQAMQALRDGPDWVGLSPAQRRAVENEVRDFVLGGVALEGEARARYNVVQQELVQLATRFAENVQDSTKAFQKVVLDRAELDGLPATALAAAAQAAAALEGHARATAESGPWLLTLDYPYYLPVMTHCKNRALREEMYRAMLAIASCGASDNTPLINRTLELRQEKAALLGFDCFAELSMAKKMATLPMALSLLEELRVASTAGAEQDLADVRAFALDAGEQEELRWWDIAFWAERLRETKYSITDEELRPYFSLPAVLDGLFQLLARLFGVEVVAADGEAPIWHPDVRFFKVLTDERPKAYLYLDAYSRPQEKQGGAWFMDAVGQSALLAAAGEALRLPVGYMMCNQSPPTGSEPSLMTFRHVETLFHECGHAMQHLLTSMEEGRVSGMRGVQWDAIELPSQFLENWCYDRRTLYSFAKHYKTQEALPEALFQRLLAAKNYRSGTQTLRQLYFAVFDLQLHSSYTPGGSETVFERVEAVGRSMLVMEPYPDDHFLCGFTHLFAGEERHSYAAGYYSYKWAEVLSADAFSAFEEVGLDNDEQVQATGRRFLNTVLGLGGSVAPAEVFKLFRGREPSTRALLRHGGLLQQAAA